MISDHPILLFVYGTLHPDRAPAAIAPVVSTLLPVGYATVLGRLLDLGQYPGLILTDDDPEAEKVEGEVFAVPDLATLAELDRYEDFRPSDPAASLFHRVKAAATLADGSALACWVYVYNR